MERRGYSLGASIAGLGLVLSCCLLPYVISSVYSIGVDLFQVPVSANWLWGDWLNTTIGVSDPMYMVLAEGPICAAGIVGLMIVVVGVVLAVGGIDEDDELYDEDEEEIV
jgi:hypothetical protein